MSRDNSLPSADERAMLEHTVLVRHRLEEQYENLEQQSQAASFGMWVFLATEVMFFGTLFLVLGVYRFLHAEAFETASRQLNWQIGAANTLVLLVSSFCMALAVHAARYGLRTRLVSLLGLTALLGAAFLSLKGYEYYTDYRENLIPGWRFDPEEWVASRHLSAAQVPHVKLFLVLYWITTGFHALHMVIGISAVLVMAVLAWRGTFSPDYYSPVDVTGLYWHFVDIVWIFLLPMLYLLGTHR